MVLSVLKEMTNCVRVQMAEESDRGAGRVGGGGWNIFIMAGRNGLPVLRSSSSVGG